jgi:hypothetical protein
VECLKSKVFVWSCWEEDSGERRCKSSSTGDLVRSDRECVLELSIWSWGCGRIAMSDGKESCLSNIGGRSHSMEKESIMGGRSTEAVTKDFAIHQHDNCAILASIKGRRILVDGLGQMDITVKARIARGLYSFECG